MNDWTRRHPRRFLLERLAMAQHFPGFRYVSRPRPSWIGRLAVPQFGRSFGVAYVYGDRYPDALPALYVLDPTLPSHTPHIYADGSICVHPDDAPMDRWTPPVSLALASAWLVKFCDWNERGAQWP